MVQNILSLSLFLYGNHAHNAKAPSVNKVSDIKTLKIVRLHLTGIWQEDFDNDITTMKEQIELFSKKKDKIFSMLGEKFNVIDKVYEKFNTIIFDVEYVLLSNIKGILNKISVFDEEDYERIRCDIAQKKFSDEVIASKMNIYNEYITFVKNAIEDNEEIILKLDALLLELSKFNTLGTGEIDNLKEIKEMDELIKKSKYYI